MKKRMSHFALAARRPSAVRRSLAAAVLLAALLMFALPALGEELNLTLTAPSGQRDYANSLCYAGETLYALGNQGLYRLTPGAQAFEVAVDLARASAYRWQTQRPDGEEEAALWRQAVTFIAADGEELIAVQPLSGHVLRLRGGALEVDFELPPEVFAMDRDEDMRRNVRAVTCQDGQLFLLMEMLWDAEDSVDLFAVDLRTHEARACSVRGAAGIAPGAQGELLLMTQGGYVSQMLGGPEQIQLLGYDIASDSARELARFEEDRFVGAAAYDAALNADVLFCEGRIVRADALDTALAYVPVSFVTSDWPAVCSPAGRYAMTGGGYVFVRDISSGEGVRKTELRVADSLSPDVLAAFSIENPDIAVIAAGMAQGTATALLTGDPALDILSLTVPGDAFIDYAARGYLAEVDSEALDAWIKTLYPAIGETVTRDGAVMGVPYSLSPDSWTIDETMWQQTGMGTEPATYAELFDAIALWLGEKAEDYPDYALSDLQQMDLQNVVQLIVCDYVLELEASGAALTFDTDAFRAAMNLLAEHADLLSDEHGQWGMPIVSGYNQGFGVSYNDSHRVRMMLAPALISGERAMTASLRVFAISAASQHRREAVRFLEWYAAHLREVDRYQMTPTLNDPIENPNYAPRVAELEEQIASLTEQLENAQDEETAAALEQRLADTQDILDRSESMRYSISPESIALYRQLARDLRIPWNSALASNAVRDSLMDVIAPICGDGLTRGEVDALIAQLDRVLDMAVREGGEKR